MKAKQAKMLKLYKSFTLSILVLGTSLLTTSCYKFNKKADPENLRRDDTGVEYAPQMYHSEPYDPMSQVTDKSAGLQYWPWDSVGTDEKHGEWFNTNYYNPHNMNMREPAANTVQRNGALPYAIAKDSLDQADRLPDPERNDSEFELAVANGEILYGRYCKHCHGAGLDGKGPVSEKFKGIANLKSAAVINRTESYIYHVITMGKNKMRSHAAIVSPEHRWDIAAYIKNEQQ